MENNDWTLMKERIKNYWTDLPKESGKDYLSQLNDAISHILSNLTLSCDTPSFFEQQSIETPSALLTREAHGIFDCALGYTIKNQPLYHSAELLDTIKKMMEKFFLTYDGKHAFGNWWDWQIGIPTWLLPTFILLENEFSPETLAAYLGKISAYIPQPFDQLYTTAQTKPLLLEEIEKSPSTGANRTDMAYLFFQIALLTQDKIKAQEAVLSTFEVFNKVSTKDGFYEDGSMIQHFTIPYNGSYGIVLLEGIARLYSAVENTPLAISADLKKRLVDIIKKSYLPFLHEGEFIVGVKGRSISRENTQHNEYGSMALLDMLVLTNIFPEKEKETLTKQIIPMIMPHISFYQKNIRHAKDVKLLHFLTTPTQEITQPNHATAFPSMDRMIYKNSKTTVGMSFYSHRISAFEAGNGENLKGWYTGDGMYQIYQQGDQFLNDYFATVNYYTLPGTTVDMRPLKDETNNFQDCLSSEKCVGGIGQKEYLVSGMILNKNGFNNSGEDAALNLVAFKSYFILNNFLICLGAGITGTTSAKEGIITTVDQRMLGKHSTPKVTSQQKQTGNLLQKNDWLYLDDGHTHLGYISLQEAPIVIKKEKRQGNYSQVNVSNDGKNSYERDYLNLTISHGKNPQNATYVYGIFLGENITEFKNNLPNLPTIIANTTSAQIIANKDKTVILGNVYSSYTCNLLNLTFNAPTMFIAEIAMNELVLHLSQPKQDGTPIDVDCSHYTLKKQPKNATFTNNKIIISTDNDQGKSYSLVLERK